MSMTTTPNRHEALLGKVARLHYEHGLTHQEVADILHVSRVKVTRLLAEARRTGVVEIRVHSDASPYADLELEVARRFRLDEAIIVPTQGDPEQQRESLAIAVAGYLQRVLRDGIVVAIGISRTIGLVPSHIVASRPIDCTFVSLTGSRSRSGDGINPHEATDRLARIFGASARNIPAPVFTATAELREAFVRDPAIAEPLACAASADLVLAGVGGMGNQLLVSTSEIRQQEVSELIARGAVGDVAARFFDAHGLPVDHSLDRRLIGLTLAQMTSIRSRMVAAGGTDKIAAVEALLEAGFATILVTDAATAASLIQTDRRNDKPGKK
jgi:lsr operon transcriptional repressor